MKKLIRNPLQRRKWLTLVSGVLILAALAADRLLGLAALGGAAMLGAALAAGTDIALRALNSLRNRQVSIELLVTIAASGALGLGEYWEAAAVTFLFVLGAYLEARTLSRTREALQRLVELAPAAAVVVRDGAQVQIPPEQVRIGETVLVKPGTRIPVDGQVIVGRSAVDESALTGESIPVDRSEGDRVYTGTVNQNGLLYVRATGVGVNTMLSRIIRRVEQAQDERAPTQRFIERMARWYTPAIIGLSALAFLLTRDIELSLTLLVIGCPGALVISTPVSVIAGIGRAAQRGILIKGGEHLETAGKISALALDKTGTLTEGKPKLTEIVALQPELVPATGRTDGPRPVPRWSGAEDSPWTPAQGEVLSWAAIAEAGSEHPLARPILSEAAAFGEVPHPEEFAVCTSRGVRATYRGHVVGVGTEELMAKLGAPISDEAEESLGRLKSAGKTTLLVAKDGVVLGVLGIADSVRGRAPEAIRRLKELGLRRIVMLTGDNARVAQSIAAQAGISEVASGLLPEDKLRIVRRLHEEGNIVAMVGDGINDALALAAADVGIAMGAGGTDVAIETADIALMADDLAKIPEAVRLSKATLRNIRENVAIALVTVAGLLAGVLAGEVHMAGGMLIHQLSVLIVIVNGMRLLRA